MAKLRTIQNTLFLLCLMTGALLGQTCARSGSGFEAKMGIRTSMMQSDLRDLKRQMDELKRSVEASR